MCPPSHLPNETNSVAEIAHEIVDKTHFHFPSFSCFFSNSEKMPSRKEEEEEGGAKLTHLCRSGGKRGKEGVFFRGEKHLLNPGTSERM